MKKHFLAITFLFFSLLVKAQEVDYLIKPTLELSSVSPFSEGMAKIQKDRLSAFLNNKGNQIIPFQYNVAYDFHSGLAVVVTQKNELIFINKKGEKIGTPNTVKKNNSGLTWYNENGDKVLISSNETKLKPWRKNERPLFESPPEEITNITANGLPTEVLKSDDSDNVVYDLSRMLNEGLRAVKKDEKWGFVTEKNKMSIIPNYDLVDDFHEGLAGVAIKQGEVQNKNKQKETIYKWGVINTKGEIIIPFTFDKIYHFSEGLAEVNLNNKRGFVDKTGKVVVPILYDFNYGGTFFKSGIVRIALNHKKGIIDKKGNTIIPFQYDDIQLYYNPFVWSTELFAWVSQNNKWGAIDKYGKVIIPLEYDYPSESLIMKGGEIRMVKNNKVGYINAKGQIIVDFVFGYDDKYENGLMLINKRGVADRTGKIILAHNYNYQYVSIISKNLIHVTLENGKVKVIKWDGEKTTEFHSEQNCDDYNLTWVVSDKKWGALNNFGELVIPFEYDEKGKVDFKTKHIPIKKNSKIGLIDTLGKVMVPFLFDYISTFNDGLGGAMRNGYWGVIDLKGNIIIPFKYTGLYLSDIIRVKRNDEYIVFNREGKPLPSFSSAASNFSDGLAYAIKNNKRGFIDKTGKTVIPFEYDGVYSFSDNLAWVNKNGQNSFIDKTGKEVIPLQKEDKDSFSDGLARVFRDNKYCSFIDKTGKIALNLPYDYALSFSEGLSWVKQDNKWGCVDKTGKIVIPIQFDDADENSFYFSEGLAWVKLNGKWGIIKNPLLKK